MESDWAMWQVLLTSRISSYPRTAHSFDGLIGHNFWDRSIFLILEKLCSYWDTQRGNYYSLVVIYLLLTLVISLFFQPRFFEIPSFRSNDISGLVSLKSGVLSLSEIHCMNRSKFQYNVCLI